MNLSMTSAIAVAWALWVAWAGPLQLWTRPGRRVRQAPR